MVDIRTRIEQAKKGETSETVAGILDEATENDADALKPILPDLLRDADWLVRASALEVIGDLHLGEFLKLVQARFEDRNTVVQGYALTTYYDLLGEKALPVIEEWCEAREVRNRVTALTLHYIETANSEMFERLSRILTRRRCHFGHRYVAMNLFDHYLDVRHRPEILKLFQDILRSVRTVSKRYGLDKDIPLMLQKWTQSSRKT